MIDQCKISYTRKKLTSGPYHCLQTLLFHWHLHRGKRGRKKEKEGGKEEKGKRGGKGGEEKEKKGRKEERRGEWAARRELAQG